MRFTAQADGNLLKVFGLDGSKCRDDPVDIRFRAQKRQILDICGVREVRKRRPTRACVHEQR